MRIKKDQLTGAILVLLGIAIAVLVNQFRVPLTPEYPGPKLFPLIAVFGFVVCGIGIFIQSTLSKKEEKTFLLKAGWAKLGIVFAILVAYTAAMKYLGYLLVTPFALFAFSSVMAKGGGIKSKILYRIIFSVGFSMFLYVVYVYAFGMLMPRGELF